MKSKTIMTALVVLLVLVAAVILSLWNGGKLSGSGEAIQTDAVTETIPADSPYSSILSAYAQALREGWDGGLLMEAGLNYMAAGFDDPLENVGFLETDLDGNGTPELFIGTLVEDPFYSKMVLSLYALDADGTPILVFDGTERNRYYYAGDIRFANLGSGAYNSSFETTLKFEHKEMIDMTYTTDPASYVQPELTPFSQWRSES